MNKFVKALTAAVILAAVLYGGLKAYIYFQYKEQVDSFISKVSPFVHIKYGGITSSLGGTVSVTDITAVPGQSQDELRIDAIELHTPGLWFLLSGASDSGQLPEKMQVSVRGVHLDLSGDLMRRFAALQLAARGHASGTQPIACSTLEGIGPAEYKALGFDSVVLDSSFGYKFGRDQTEFYLDYALRDIETMRMTMALSGLSRSLRSFTLQQALDVLLTDLSLQYAMNPELALKATRHCIQASGVDDKEYYAAALERGLASIDSQLGVVPGQGIREALGRYLAKPGEIRVTAHPNLPVQLAAIDNYRPESLVALLNLKASVNGEPIADLSVAAAGGGAASDSIGSRGPGLLHSLPISALGGSVAPEPQARSREKRSAKNYVEGFRVVNRRDLRKYVGREVRIRTRDGKQRNGWLAAVRNEAAAVEQRLYGGKMTVQVPVPDIDKVEVWLYTEK
jgi:hypothetical protein